VDSAAALGATEVSNNYGGTERNGDTAFDGPTGSGTPNGLSAF
jgi:hypothetical protein